MKNRFYVFLVTCASVMFCNGQSFVVQNNVVERTILFKDGHLSSETYKLKSSNRNFIHGVSSEFSFTANDSLYSGQSIWKDLISSDTTTVDGGKGINISLKDKDDQLSVKLTYLVYPDISAIRKFISIENCGKKDLKIENVNVEDLKTSLNPCDSWTYHNYARDIVFGQYDGNWNDPLMILHNYPSKSGLAVGNETYGVLKRTQAFLGGQELKVGLTTNEDSYPFRKWLSLHESWISPAVFTIPYENVMNPQEIVNTEVQTLVRKHMGTQIEKRPTKPILVYNTWRPFGQNVNENLIFELATAASECGVKEFVIDDGWQINLRNGNGQIFADWGIDTIKFPHGLKPVFDSIKSLGMKPGLWISLANCYKNGIAYNKHPEWIITNKDGQKISIHSDNPGYDNPTACMATDWCDYIRDVVLSYVKDYGLAYVKLDLAIVTSAYIYDTQRTGCYSTNHKYHRDHQDSYWMIYDRCMKMFDELHKAAPELFIDCTFETAGKLQLMDYGIAEHADGNWLSNIDGCLRARNLAWRRTPALHPACLVIGNLQMNNPQHILALKSLAGTLPIMLGDPRKLSPEEREEYKQWETWLEGLENRHGFMSFRQDLRGFGEPQDGMWDGFSRINTESKSGGLVGVFRENAPEESRVVVIKNLDPESTYLVKKGFKGEIITKMKGSELSDKGFNVVIKEKIGGELFEIVKE